MTREKRTQLYLTAAQLGAFGSPFWIAAWALDLPEFFKGLPLGLLIVPLIVILIRSIRDEYFENLWRAGISLAFVAVVPSFLFAPFLEGVFGGFTVAPQHQDLALATTGIMAIISFFLGFHVKWLKGAR